MTFLLNLITAAVLYGTPLLYGTTGEILTEKSGNLNLGVEGMMFMGGAVGLGAAARPPSRRMPRAPDTSAIIAPASASGRGAVW